MNSVRSIVASRLASLCAAGALALAGCASDAPAEGEGADSSSPELLASLSSEGFLLHGHQLDLNGNPYPAATDGMITADKNGVLGSRTDATLMDGIALQVGNAWPACLQIRYRAHVADIGDTEWVDAGSWVGAWGKRIEAIQFQVDHSSCPGDDYATWYLYGTCTNRQGVALGMESGQWCGTKGESLALTSLEVFRGFAWSD